MALLTALALVGVSGSLVLVGVSGSLALVGVSGSLVLVLAFCFQFYVKFLKILEFLNPFINMNLYDMMIEIESKFYLKTWKFVISKLCNPYLV